MINFNKKSYLLLPNKNSSDFIKSFNLYEMGMRERLKKCAQFQKY